ncbi:MAG: peptide ABC transporter substrate-binding protein [Halieaceae bacterium]|nr:peptide ABC transporter substrate-binding protein [Halieaceae bacterium]
MAMNGGFLQRLAFGLVAVLSMLALLACSQGESNVAAGNRDGVLHFGNGTEPQTIDPHVMSGMPEVNVARALYEGLVVRNPQTLEMEPGVAERWDISEDGKVMTFHLNPRARWSNGDPVTAEDFAWSLRRSLHPDLGNQLAYTLFPIAGAQAYATGADADSDKLGIRVLGDLTLQITLDNPDPFFLETLGTYPAFPVHRATVEAHGKLTDRFTPWTRVGNFVGNGAFTLSEWRLNRRLVVSKSDTYWNAEQVALNAVVFHPVENAVGEEKMFRAGQLHYTNQVPLNKIPAYRSMTDSPYRQAPWQGSYFLQFNVNRPPVDDRRVRMALAMAIDRERLVRTVLKDTELASFALVPAGTPEYSSPEIQSYSPDKARALLAEAGYPGGEGWPGLEYLFNTSENHRKIGIALQQMWREELNIDISLVNQEWKVYLDTISEENYQLSRRGWIASDLNPATFLDMFTSESGTNDTGFAHARYDEIMLALVPQTPDAADRLALMQEAEAIVLQEAVVMPLYTYNSKHLVQPSVKGAPTNVLDLLNLKDVSLDPDAAAWTIAR